MHKYIQIQHLKSSKGYSEVFLFEDITVQSSRFESKVDYQRSVVKQIVCELLATEVSIDHNDSGAPFMVDFPEKYISISHSKNLYAIQLSDRQCVGVDVQVIKEGLAKGKDYFVNNEEQEFIDLSNINLHLIWSAKEAVYKKYKGGIDKYKDGMVVSRILDNTIVLKSCGKNEECSYLFTKEYVLVYVK